jgi:UPF0755 protein
MQRERKHVIETLNRCREWCVECRFFERAFGASLAVGILGAVVYLFLFAPPRGFETPTVIKVPSGKPVVSIAADLEKQQVIQSRFWFTLSLLVSGRNANAIAGNYYFPHPQNVFTVAHRIASGDYELTPVKVTLPEGATISEMAQILEDRLGTFDAETFLSLTEGKEGYLFPDTYYFLPAEDPETVVQALQENFFAKIETLQEDLTTFGKPLSDVITMASLLEEEARTLQSRQIIAGILWKRIEKGMRLQVDAVFPYIIGKNTFEVTRADLAVDSPYNTYRYEGLPLGPISNPGLSSIEAAITPVETPYLYYLSDMQGRFHWSRTYEEHLRKRDLYLGS